MRSISTTCTTRGLLIAFTVNHVSYNGGPGGINARPTPQEEAAERGRHKVRLRPDWACGGGAPESAIKASANHGKAPGGRHRQTGRIQRRTLVAARKRQERRVVIRQNAAVKQPAMAGVGGCAWRKWIAAVHPNELPPAQRAPAPNTGNRNSIRSTRSSRTGSTQTAAGWAETAAAAGPRAPAGGEPQCKSCGEAADGAAASAADATDAAAARTATTALAGSATTARRRRKTAMSGACSRLF